VDETEFGDEIDDTVTLRNLHGDGEIVCCFWREEDVDCLFREWRVWRLVTDFYYVELSVSSFSNSKEKVAYSCTSSRPDCESKKLGGLRSRVQLECCESSGVTLDRLRDTPLDRVELESSLDLKARWVGVGRDTDQD
jgi:hypothetical protein